MQVITSVKIPEKIANYLKNIGSFDGLVSKGTIIEKIGSIARNELDELKVEQEVSPQKEKILGRQGHLGFSLRARDQVTVR